MLKFSNFPLFENWIFTHFCNLKLNPLLRLLLDQNRLVKYVQKHKQNKDKSIEKDQRAGINSTYYMPKSMLHNLPFLKLHHLLLLYPFLIIYLSDCYFSNQLIVF